jgi:hypothetical protein
MRVKFELIFKNCNLLSLQFDVSLSKQLSKSKPDLIILLSLNTNLTPLKTTHPVQAKNLFSLA